MIRSPEAVREISFPAEEVRRHYDDLTEAYERLWGPHLHHGYWESDETPEEAQVRLIEKLAEHAPIPYGSSVLDAGCGTGGPAVWLARNLGCTVTGVTLSPRQAERARERAEEEGLEDRLHFQVLDAAELDAFAPEYGFDAVWVVECSEHLADKAGFIRSCARALKPGGALALAAWTSAEEPGGEQSRLLSDICRAMLCPSLGTLEDYSGWMRGAGLRRVEAADVTPFVERTWEEALSRIGTPEAKRRLAAADGPVRRFAEAFQLMRRAYAEGALGYGIFSAGRGLE